jgi:hypothetical protein
MKHFDVIGKNAAVVGMQSLETARTRDDDRPHLLRSKYLRPPSCFLRKLAVAHAAELACTAGLFLAEDRELYPCLLKQACRLHSHRLHRRIEARCATGKIEDRSRTFVPGSYRLQEESCAPGTFGPEPPFLLGFAI